jgi:hypothetical protein
MFLILQSATKDRENRLCAMNKVRIVVGGLTACYFHSAITVLTISYINGKLFPRIKYFSEIQRDTVSLLE